MRRHLLLPAATALLASACIPSGGSEARPNQTPPSSQETLPPDAGELDDPQDVVQPGTSEGMPADGQTETDPSGS